jgi:5-methylcytosine-specific restriction endonuclease McrA
MNEFPPELLSLIAGVKNKRAKIVLDGIVANGGISTDELKEIGYNQAPRAAADVRELGIQLKTTMVKNSAGKRMARYTFADKPLEANKVGRQQVPKKTRDALIADSQGKCDVCGSSNNLQIDHKIPYIIAGESDKQQVEPFQVLCGSCNRTKSWNCEHCENVTRKDPAVCQSCYWADQSKYEHVAMRPERRIELVWTGEEMESFERVRRSALLHGRTPAEEIKARLASRKKN